MARTIARRVGRYEILREIGRGGMATVYLAMGGVPAAMPGPTS